MTNLYSEFKELTGGDPLLVGDVTYADAQSSIRLVQPIGGGQLVAKGTAAVGKRVFVRGNVIEGEAPTLPYHEIQI